MPTYTSKYKFTKPLGTDLYDVGVFNGNMDAVEAALIEVASTLKPISEGGTGADNANTAINNLLVKTLIDHSNQVDCNTIRQIGIYRIYFSDTSLDPTTLNYPSRYGDMLVFGASSYVVQLFTDMAAHRMYFRSTSNAGSTWSEWHRYAVTDSNGAVPINGGGTGGTSRSTGAQNLLFLGITPISSPDEDTVTNWRALGTGFAWYSTLGLLNNQPNQWGLVISYVYQGMIYQFWYSMGTDAGIYRRHGVDDTWRSNWIPVYDKKMVIYSETQPAVVNDALWLKPIG